MSAAGAARFSLAGSVAVVTGAASGLGAAIAVGLAAAGADVALADVDAARLEEVEQQVVAAGRRSLAAAVDVRDAEAVAALERRVARELGPADVLVNSAGVTCRGRAEEFADDDWERVLAVNLTGTFRCCRAFAAGMLARGSGSVVNVASIAGLVGLPNTVAYCASKGGVVALTRALAVEWGPRGVRVNAVAPGTFDTPLTRGILEREPGFRAEVESRMPLGRIGLPEEVVGAVVFLAGPASSLVTGQVLAVDAGFLAT